MMGCFCRNVKIKLDPAKGEHWRPVAVTVPTSSGAKRMAFDQPFTCISKQHLCLSVPQRCCAGKRHCCNCKKMLAGSANSSASDLSGGAGGVVKSTNVSVGGGAAANGTIGGATLMMSGKRKIQDSAPKRTHKRLFATLGSGADTDKEGNSIGGGDDGGSDDRGLPGGDAKDDGATGDGATATGGTSAAAGGVEREGEGHVQHEIEDVASMLLLFCSARCGCANDVDF